MNHNYIWRFNVLQICLSLPPFVFGVLFTPSCDGLRGVSKFRDTALIIGWFSNRTGTSFYDRKVRRNDQIRLATNMVLGKIVLLTLRRQNFCCLWQKRTCYWSISRSLERLWQVNHDILFNKLKHYGVWGSSSRMGQKLLLQWVTICRIQQLQVSGCSSRWQCNLEILFIRGTQRQFLENICSGDDLGSRIFGAFVVKFLAFLPLLGFSKI